MIYGLCSDAQVCLVFLLYIFVVKAFSLLLRLIVCLFVSFFCVQFSLFGIVLHLKYRQR